MVIHTVLTRMAELLPPTALCALSSGTLHFSRSLAPAHLAGLADDPAKEKTHSSENSNYKPLKPGQGN